MFLATNGRGVTIFDRRSEQLRTLGVAEGLPTEYFNVLSDGESGHLHLGSCSRLALVRWQGEAMAVTFAITPIDLGVGAGRDQV